jgi:hypothetical protein
MGFAEFFLLKAKFYIFWFKIFMKLWKIIKDLIYFKNVFLSIILSENKSF